ncbi:hypothetical protein [Helicobacter pylori]|uniref:hypothetical protein n=1 Tax=Helicobacter pylori TaxID=210 RepID=UPI002AC68DAB|nr:hypothetical protein [Helicobacter pylori]MDZ5288700.1 hypothetical protein [Helicobacter pylori]
MLQMTGMVVNLFTKEGGKDKEGKQYEPTHKVQLLGEVDLPNGDVQNELVDLKVDSLDDWLAYKGKNVAVDVGVYAVQKNMVVYFIKKGTKPRLQDMTSL